MAYYRNTKNPKAASDTTETQRQLLRNAVGGIIEPPQGIKLTKTARRWWDYIMQTRRGDAWTPTDLMVAAELANVFVDLHKARREVTREGRFYIDHNGNPKTHPLHGILRELSNQVIALCRFLHIHPAATEGLSHDARRANQAARDIQGEAEQVQDDLEAGLIGSMPS